MLKWLGVPLSRKWTLLLSKKPKEPKQQAAHSMQALNRSSGGTFALASGNLNMMPAVKSWWTLPGAISCNCLTPQRTYWSCGHSDWMGGSWPTETSRCLTAARYTKMVWGLSPCWARKAMNRQAACSDHWRGLIPYWLQNMRGSVAVQRNMTSW